MGDIKKALKLAIFCDYHNTRGGITWWQSLLLYHNDTGCLPSKSMIGSASWPQDYISDVREEWALAVSTTWIARVEHSQGLFCLCHSQQLCSRWWRPAGDVRWIPQVSHERANKKHVFVVLTPWGSQWSTASPVVTQRSDERIECLCKGRMVILQQHWSALPKEGICTSKLASGWNKLRKLILRNLLAIISSK